MKKVSIVFFVAVLTLVLAPGISAQTLDGAWDMPVEKIRPVRAGNDVGNLKVGLDAGYATPLRPGYGMKFDVEVRYNASGTPWDLGLQYAAIGAESPKWGVKLYSNAMLSFHVDYNWRLWNNIAPFAGLGAGYYNGESLNPNNVQGHDGTTVSSDSAFLSLRAGCEFWDHLRITAEYRPLFGSAPSVVSLTLGWSFFGGHGKK